MFLGCSCIVIVCAVVKRGLRAAAAGVGLLMLGGCGVALAVLLIVKGPRDTAPAAGVMGVVLGLPALAIALWSWARRGTEVTADQVGQARESLAGWVIDQWRHEALARSLGNPEPMPVQWRLTERAVMDSRQLIMTGQLSFAARSDRIGPLAEEFRRLRHRRLVILGGPGAGKTTLAVQLLLELLATRGAGEQIPVLLSLARWDPTEQPRLHGWLAERLAVDYPSLRAFGPGVARALVEQGHILPILDGLDELPLARQPDVISALNASLTDADQLVLTSRTCEYQTAIAQAHTVLTAAAVIEPEPLTSAQAADYLAACLPPDPGPSWRAVLDQLRAGKAEHLATVVATPLGLWLLRTVYLTPQADPRPLLPHDDEVARDAATMQAHLFNQLIPAVLTSRPASRNANEPFRPRRTWDSTKVGSWLTYLAQHLDRTGTRDLLWWHLASHTFTRPAFGLVVALVFGLGTGLVLGLVYGLGTEGGVALMFGLGVGLGTGLAVALVFGMVVWRGVGLGFALGTGLVVGLGFVLGTGLVTPVGELGAGLGTGLQLGLGPGLVLGLRARLGGQDWFTDEPAYANLRLKHRAGLLVRDLGVGLVLGLGTGLLLGLVYGLVEGLVEGLDRLVVRLVVGLVVGLVYGLVLGLFKWMGTPSRTGWISTPRSTYKATRTLTVIQICLGGLVLGLVPGRLELWVVVFGVVIGLVVALGLVSSGAWFSYILASCRLAAAGKLPLRLMDFLDDAYRLGLLRTTGPAYQFRHAEFHDHLIRTGGYCGPALEPRHPH